MHQNEHFNNLHPLYCTIIEDRLPLTRRHMSIFIGFDNSEAYQGEFEDQEFLSM